MNRHNGLNGSIQAKLEDKLKKLWSLNEMERTAVNRTLLVMIRRRNEYIFYDCSAESPKGRRSLCYDRERGVKERT